MGHTIVHVCKMTFQELKVKPNRKIIAFYIYICGPCWASHRVYYTESIWNSCAFFCDVHRKRVLMRTGRQIASGLEPSSLAEALCLKLCHTVFPLQLRWVYLWQPQDVGEEVRYRRDAEINTTNRPFMCKPEDAKSDQD